MRNHGASPRSTPALGVGCLQEAVTYYFSLHTSPADVQCEVYSLLYRIYSHEIKHLVHFKNMFVGISTSFERDEDVHGACEIEVNKKKRGD